MPLVVDQGLRTCGCSGLCISSRRERRGRETVYSLGDEHIAHIVNDALVHARERRSV